MRDPDTLIYSAMGEPYLRRWYLIPRNRWFNVYLHEFIAGDGEREMHDHPWYSLSIILKGCYVEHSKKGIRVCRAGDVLVRSAKFAHRISLVDPSIRCWSLFITAWKIREWGFLCPKGWVSWKQYQAKTNRVKGCDS